MKRIRTKLLSFFAVICLMVALPVGGVALAADEDAYSQAVDMLYDLNIFPGKERSDLIGPDCTMTRAELAKMMTMVRSGGGRAQLKDYEPLAFFPEERTPVDAVGHWALPYIQFAVDKEFTDGCGNGMFLPDAQATGLQCAKMLMNLLGYTTANEKFSGAQWESAVYAKATELGLFNGFEEGFDPSKTVTYSEAALMTQNALTLPVVRYEYVLSSTDGVLAIVPTLRYLDPSRTLYEYCYSPVNEGSQ